MIRPESFIIEGDPYSAQVVFNPYDPVGDRKAAENILQARARISPPLPVELGEGVYEYTLGGHTKCEHRATVASATVLDITVDTTSDVRIDPTEHSARVKADMSTLIKELNDIENGTGEWQQ